MLHFDLWPRVCWPRLAQDAQDARTHARTTQPRRVSTIVARLFAQLINLAWRCLLNK